MDLKGGALAMHNINPVTLVTSTAERRFHRSMEDAGTVRYTTGVVTQATQEGLNGNKVILLPVGRTGAGYRYMAEGINPLVMFTSPKEIYEGAKIVRELTKA